MKQIKMFLTVILVLGLMAAPVFAGTVAVTGAGTGGLKIAKEILGVSRTVIATGTTASSTTSGVDYLTAGSAPANGQVRFQLSSGINFNTQLLRLCLASTTSSATAAATQVDSITPSTGASNVTFNTVNILATGSLLYLSNDSTSCAGTPFTTFLVPANTTVGKYSINAFIVGSGLDSGTSVNAVEVVRQTTTALAASKLIAIDYLAATTGNPTDGTRFVLSAPGSNAIAGSANVFMASSTLAGFATNGSMSTASVAVNYTTAVNLTDTAGWQGVTRVYMATDNASCSYALNSASNITPVGTVTLNRAGFVTGAAAANDYSDALCILTDGLLPLNRRTITASVYYTASSGGLAPPSITNMPVMSWVPNGYQAFNSYMYMGADRNLDVFNRFYNNSALEAKVFVEVFPPAGGASTTYTLAPIPANSSGTYWGSDIGVLAGLNAGDSYAARFTVTATPNMVNGNAFFKRSTANDRYLPLYKEVYSGGTTDAYLSQ